MADEKDPDPSLEADQILYENSLVAVSDEEIAELERWRSVAAKFINEAETAACLFPDTQLLACGELLAALGRFFRDSPVRSDPESNPQKVVMAMISTIRDLSYGSLPPLIANHVDPTRQGYTSPLSTSTWHARAVCVAAIETLRTKAGVKNYSDAIKEIQKAGRSLGISNIREQFSVVRSMKAASDLDAILEWRREIKDKIKRKDSKNFPIETVTVLMIGPHVEDGLPRDNVKRLILDWFSRQMLLWNDRSGK